MIVFLTILMPLCACLYLTGCGMAPYCLETWYLTGYSDENGEFRNVGYDTAKQTCLYSDDITLRYFEDGTFIFKEFDREYTGTYDYETGKKETLVSLAFSDGSKGNGVCAKYMFDGVWYDGSLQAFGKEYAFSGKWVEQGLGERFDFPYTRTGQNIAEMLKSGETETKDFYHSNSYTLYKGKIELRGEEYFFVPHDNNTNGEMNLSQARELFTYEIAEDYSVERGNNTLREGKCFINYNTYKKPIDSENVETSYEYAVWYYKDFFSIVYPTANLGLKDVLSVKAVDGNVSDSYYSTWIWKQDSKELSDFYELFSGQYVLPKTELSETEKTPDNQVIYFIKTAERTYTVICEFVYEDNSVRCVVDGKYYQVLSDNRLLLNPRGKRYYSLKNSPDGAEFFIDGEYVKNYGELLDEVIFDINRDYDYGKTTSSEYVLKSGSNTLILLDEKHFIWRNGGVNRGCEICGEVDFSGIFAEYPTSDES